MSPAESETSRLCEDCSRLCFDEQKFGGKVGKSDNGKPSLDIPVENPETPNYRSIPVEGFRKHDVYPELEGLLATANRGCVFCKCLREVLSSDEVTEVVSDLKTYLGVSTRAFTLDCVHWKWPVDGSRIVLLDFSVFNEGLFTVDGERGYWSFHFASEVSKASGAASSVDSWMGLSSQSPPATYLNLESLEWLKTRLSECISHVPLPEWKPERHPHGYCEYDGAKHIPTRLIDVQSEPLRLMDRHEVAASTAEPRYTALSYCWGTWKKGVKSFTTTTAAFPNIRKEGIPMQELPQTLQDAVYLTRALSIPYLWIDAICIIQGDTTDWERESKVMDQIYSGAYLTICSLGPSSKSGFLRQDQPVVRLPFSSQLRPTIRGSIQLRFAGTVVGALHVPHVPQARLPNSRYWGRGWTFQEQLLSSRSIIFGNSTMVFSCSSKTKFEDESQEEEEYFYSAIKNLQQTMRKGSSHEAIETVWTTILTNFSMRHFTVRQDVFPALSGVASAFAQALDDTYVAGIWKANMVGGLMWSSQKRFKTHTSLQEELVRLEHQDPYISPSWSPVGTLGQISYGEYHAIDMNKSWVRECDADIKVEVDGQNPFGRLKSAVLRFSGVTLRAETLSDFEKTADGHLFYSMYRTRLNQMGVFDIDPDWLQIWDVKDQSEQLHGDFRLALLCSFVDREDISTSIYDEGPPEDFPREKRGAAGLILHPNSTGDKYIRIGRFITRYGAGGGLKAFNWGWVEDLEII